MRRTTLVILSALAALALPALAEAGCGCDKPPPPRAAVRPFVGYTDLKITLFNDSLVPGQKYDVLFVAAADGSFDWSTGKAAARRDLADGSGTTTLRNQLRVKVGKVSLGPCEISVWQNGVPLYRLGDDAFTVTGLPITLHDFKETVARKDYRAGIGRDGTLYLTFDVDQVTEATTFTGTVTGFPLRFSATNVAMYNTQGFLMQLLDPTVLGLFQISTGDPLTSNSLSYWRHEFATYKANHRQDIYRRTDDDPDWHADGTYHVDHDTIVVAIAGTFDDGTSPTPGPTPPLQLTVSATDQPLGSSTTTSTTATTATTSTTSTTVTTPPPPTTTSTTTTTVAPTTLPPTTITATTTVPSPTTTTTTGGLTGYVTGGAVGGGTVGTTSGGGIQWNSGGGPVPTISGCAPQVRSIAANFNGTPIASGSVIWFDAVLSASGLAGRPVTLRFENSTITFTAGGKPYTLAVPNGKVVFDPTAPAATTAFTANGWLTTTPPTVAGNTFAAGLGFRVPVALPGGINPVTWTTSISTDTTGVTINWKWTAAVYTAFTTDNTALGVKPVDDGKTSVYKNADTAGTPEKFKAFLVGGARNGGYSGTTSVACK